MGIQRYDIGEYGSGMQHHTDGDWVSFEDHIASHAFDEAKERSRFENFAVDRRGGYGDLPFFIFSRKETGEYVDGTAELAWEGWLACAKSRAKQ